MARKSGQLISRGSRFTRPRSGIRNVEIPQQNYSGLVPRSTKLSKWKAAGARDRASPSRGSHESESMFGPVADDSSQTEDAAKELQRLRSVVAASHPPSPRDEAARRNPGNRVAREHHQSQNAPGVQDGCQGILGVRRAAVACGVARCHASSRDCMAQGAGGPRSFPRNHSAEALRPVFPV